jgi:hypothetical protein
MALASELILIKSHLAIENLPTRPHQNDCDTAATR